MERHEVLAMMTALKLAGMVALDFRIRRVHAPDRNGRFRFLQTRILGLQRGQFLLGRGGLGREQPVI